MKLAGKNILITGAAKRIGREIALHLASCGANIAIHYGSSDKEARQLGNEVLKCGVKAWKIQCDFSHHSDSLVRRVKAFSKKVIQTAGSIDVLVNNASIFYPTEWGNILEKDWDEMMSVNLKAPFFLAQEFGMRMLKRKSGKIINLVDWTGDRPAKRFLPYAISKAGLIAATKGLAKNLAPHVQVMGIAPGPILHAEYASKKEQKLASDRTLLKRYGHPKDIASTVRFLIEDSDFMTGSVIYCDGGAALV